MTGPPSRLQTGALAERTVRIRLDIGRRLWRCRDRRLSEGPELRATITDLPNIAPVDETFIAEAGLSDRVSTLAADGVAAPPASLPLQRRSGKIDDGGSVIGNVRSAATRRSVHEPGGIFIVEAFSTFCAHRDRCMLVPRRRRNCRSIAIALVADVTRAAGRQRRASLRIPLAQTGVASRIMHKPKRS